MAGDCNHLQVSSRSYLVVDASRLLCPQLGVGLEYLHVATPGGLYKCGSLVVPDSVVVGYKSKYLRGQCMEIAVFLSLGLKTGTHPLLPCFIGTAITKSRLKGKGHRSHLFMRRVPKNFGTMF